MATRIVLCQRLSKTGEYALIPVEYSRNGSYKGYTAPKEPIVQTNLGKLRGAFANGVYSFKGIHCGA